LNIFSAGPVLSHDRFTAGDPGFVSDIDFDSTVPGEQTLAIGSASILNINLGAGNDTFASVGTTCPLRVFGGPGNDLLLGGTFADIISGGPGNDTIDANQGDDIILGGDGEDAFIWDPGDGSDTIDGGLGDDTLVFNSANIGEIFDYFALNGRLFLSRDIGTITMDVGSVETVDHSLLGGADTVNVNDLSSTDVRALRFHLGTSGTTNPDLQLDILNL
jgi:Ca2+-binding RTX toxin-like protein